MTKIPKFRRAVSLLIAFLFIFECFPARTFAASAPALTYSIDIEGAKESGGTNVFYANQRGDAVTVRFMMSRTDTQESYSLNTMQNEIEYDMSFFEFVENSISVEKSGVDAELQTRVMGQEIVKVAALNGSEFAPEQLMCSFQLKIKSDAQSDSGWVRCSEAKAVATDYASATVTERNLEVRLKQSGLTVTATGYNAAYDGAEHAVTATPSVTDGTTVAYSVDNGESWSETAPSRKDVGTTQVKVRAKNDLYFDATADAVLKVTPKALTVTADAASKTFGDADPQLTYSVDGLIDGDSVSGTPEREAGENVGTYAISQGTLSAGDNYSVSFQGANFTIHPKDIGQASISLSAHTLTYNGAEQNVSVSAVTLDGTALTEADYTVSGVTSGTTVNAYTLTVTGKGNYTGSASVEWKIVNAGMGAKAENVSVTYDRQPHGITVTDVPSGAAITYSTDGKTYSETNPAFTDAGARVVYYKITASGYDEFIGSATVTIAKRPVTVSGIAAANKVYDGTTDAQLDLSDAVFENIMDGDSLTVTASGAFDSPDAGENKTVAITGLALGGDAASNYELASQGQQSSTSANITPADMTVTATGYEGVYDRKSHSPSVDAPDGAEILWSDAENGSYAAGTPSFTDAGTYAAYYRVQRPNYKTVSSSVSVTIARKSVEGATVLLEQNEFIYDGETHIAVVQMVTLPDGDILSETDYSVSDDRTANAGYYLLTVTGQGNYKDTAKASWTIRNAGAGGISAANISTTYDGKPHSVSVVGAPSGAVIAYSTDGETYSESNPEYTDAGTGRTVYYRVTVPNYDEFNGSATITIAKRPVTVSGIAAANKAYDGNTNATLDYSGVTFNGIVDGDELTVSATGTFADAEVGDGKTVNITNLTLGGKSVGNYQLAAKGQQTTTTADITSNGEPDSGGMNVTAQGWTGTYDGETHSITVNAPDGATVTYSESENGAYSANAPAYTNAGNYTVFYKVTLAGFADVNGSKTVTIRKKDIVISGIAAANKSYDGNANATLIYSAVTFNGIVDGDELTVSATGTFADAEAGDGKIVRITDLTLGGKSVGNYQLAANGQQTETTANITANALNVTASGYSGVYDGEFHGITVNAPSGAAVTYSESESGTYGAENPTYKNAGTYTVYYKVSMTGYADVTGNEVVSISKATLTLSLTMVDRSNPNQLRNTWPYADVPGVPSMGARCGLTEVSDYGLTVYSYKSASGAEYLPYSAEALERLPVGAYVLRVEVGENRNYLSADAETGFTVRKAARDDVSVGPLNVVVNGENELSVSLESYLEEGFQCAVSSAEGNLFSGEPAMDGGLLRFHTANSGDSGAVRVTVSSLNYEDYEIAVTFRAASALTLRFEANGGSEVTTVKSLRPGEPYGTLPAPGKPGYHFDGWFTALTGGERVSGETVMGGVDTTLYARWTKTDYTVTLRLNGGSLPPDASGWNSAGNDATRIFHIDSEDFTLPEATRTDYTFTGWTTPGQDIAQAALEVTVFQGAMQNLTYEANWTEGERIGVVEFEKPDEGSGILGVLNLTQEPGEIDAQKSDTDTDEYPATSLAKALKEIACADETEVGENQTKDVTVSMNLRALSDLTDADEETLDETSRQSKREQERIKEAARRTFGESDDTVKSDFLSIDLEKIVTVKDDGGGESRESNALRVSPKVLEIPLRYNMTGRYNPIVFRFHDAAAALRRLASRPRNYQPAENGFDGSFYVSGAGNDAVIYIYTSRFSLYSVTTSGTESWTVFFETDGGTKIPHQSVPRMRDGKVTRPDNPTKAGYAFAGWYVLDNGEEKPFDFNAPISGDFTIYAKWTENAPVTPVTPSYSGGGGGSGSRSYRIEVADAEHGSVTVSAKTATNGQRVTVTVTPESGYLTDGVTVKTAADKNVTVTKSGTNVFRFTMPANNVTVSVVFLKQDADSGDTETETPPDNGDSETNSTEVAGPLSPEETGVADWLITDTHPAYIGGFRDGTFRPESNITRAQAAMMFYRLLKNKAATKTVTFKDMNGSEWYAEAVYALAGFDIIRGYSDGSFHGNEGISRAAFTAIAIRLAKETVPDNAERFYDVPSGHWARGTIAQASDYGWIGGYEDGTFHPSAPITRAAVTAIINRMLNRNADKEYVAEHYAELNHFSDVTDSNAWYFYNVMEAANAHDFNVSEGKERWTR